eukprot:m.407580 g.407580  ORF g.407580 m.407580 type:complete len:406 (+) comp21228_c0_seq3:670-1887(+)
MDKFVGAAMSAQRSDHEGCFRQKTTLKGINCDVLAVRFAPQGSDKVAVGCSDGNIRIYNASGECEHVATLTSPNDIDPVTCLRYAHSSSAEIFAGYASGVVLRWHTSTHTCLTTMVPKHSGSVLALDVAPDRDDVAIAGESQYVEIFDGETRQSTVQLGRGKERASRIDQKIPECHTNRIHCVKYHPAKSAEILYSAGWDGVVLEWSLSKQLVLRVLSGTYLAGDAIDIDVGGSLLISGSYRAKDQLQVWNIADTGNVETYQKKPVASIPYGKSQVYCCQLHRKNPDFVAVGGNNLNQLVLLDRKEGFTAGRVKTQGAVYSCDFNAKGSLLVGGGSRGTAFICSVVLAEQMPVLMQRSDDPELQKDLLTDHSEHVARVKRENVANAMPLDLQPSKDTGSDDDDAN